SSCWCCAHARSPVEAARRPSRLRRRSFETTRSAPRSRSEEPRTRGPSRESGRPRSTPVPRWRPTTRNVVERGATDDVYVTTAAIGLVDRLCVVEPGRGAGADRRVPDEITLTRRLHGDD